eukprot:gene4564-6436_t
MKNMYILLRFNTICKSLFLYALITIGYIIQSFKSSEPRIVTSNKNKISDLVEIHEQTLSNALESQLKFTLNELFPVNNVPNKVSLDILIQRNFIQSYNWGCLDNVKFHSISSNLYNHWLSVPKAKLIKNLSTLNGTSVWINEWMALGHAMYDIVLIQILQSTQINRIIIQRAPCMRDDLCNTWNSWFQGYFTAMIEAFQPGIPIYLRMYNTSYLSPVYLSKDSNIIGTNNKRGNRNNQLNPPRIDISNDKVCFERLIRRYCSSCFYESISSSAIRKFKKLSYQLVPRKPKLRLYFIAGEPLIITFAYRSGTASRRIGNIELLQNYLYSTFENNNSFIIRSFDTTLMYNTKGFSYKQQIRLVAESHIVIAEHGAFQANMIYMRNGSLLIDLRGNYNWMEFTNFENLARMFGVFLKPVVIHELKSHFTSNSYQPINISIFECKSVIDIIQSYHHLSPFRFNVI